MSGADNARPSRILLRPGTYRPDGDATCARRPNCRGDFYLLCPERYAGPIFTGSTWKLACGAWLNGRPATLLKRVFRARLWTTLCLLAPRRLDPIPRFEIETDDFSIFGMGGVVFQDFGKVFFLFWGVKVFDNNVNGAKIYVKFFFMWKEEGKTWNSLSTWSLDLAYFMLRVTRCMGIVIIRV